LKGQAGKEKRWGTDGAQGGNKVQGKKGGGVTRIICLKGHLTQNRITLKGRRSPTEFIGGQGKDGPGCDKFLRVKPPEGKKREKGMKRKMPEGKGC